MKFKNKEALTQSIANTSNKISHTRKCYKLVSNNMNLSFFLIMTHFYTLIVGVDHTQWHTHTYTR
jgi:hypothetical protein